MPVLDALTDYENYDDYSDEEESRMKIRSILNYRQKLIS
jgi:hypothetical protein